MTLLTIPAIIILMAQNTYHEGRGEPFDGQVAINHVILQRVINRKSSVESVINQPHQFSWTSGGASIKHIDKFVGCQEAVIEALKQRLNGDDFGRADHYYAFQGPNAIEKPTWAKSMKLVAEIGNHAFYRSK